MTHLTPFLNALAWRQQASPLLSPTQKQWLTRSGALTEGLRSLGALKLEVIDERSQQPAVDEALGLKMSPTKAAWIREVVMSIDGVPCILARSLTDLRASTGIWRGLRQLGNRPLADMLYNDPRVRRSPFEFTLVRHTQGLAQALSNGPDLNATQAPRTALFARRSIFNFQVKRLLVSECFLPSFWPLVNQQTNT